MVYALSPITADWSGESREAVESLVEVVGPRVECRRAGPTGREGHNLRRSREGYQCRVAGVVDIFLRASYAAQKSRRRSLSL
jgi:hypothetical protein